MKGQGSKGLNSYSKWELSGTKKILGRQARDMVLLYMHVSLPKCFVPERHHSVAKRLMSSD